jgi:hypothetical protein
MSFFACSQNAWSWKGCGELLNLNQYHPVHLCAYNSINMSARGEISMAGESSGSIDRARKLGTVGLLNTADRGKNTFKINPIQFTHFCPCFPTIRESRQKAWNRKKKMAKVTS